MTDILDQPRYKLGLIHDPQPPLVPDLATFATSPIPTPPVLVEAPDAEWPMADNDKIGCCTIAAAVHVDQAGAAITSEPWTYPGDAEVQSVYFGLTGGGDTGLMLPQVLTPWKSPGLFGSEDGGSASVNVKNTTLLKQAIWIFGNLYIAVNLPAIAQQQFRPDGSGVWELTHTDADYDIEGGHCLTPEARVLTESLEWIPVGELAEGDRIIGFDERIEGQGRRRRFKVGTVESAERLRLPCYELEFEDGTVVTSAYDHLWLAGASGPGRGLRWLKTEDMRPLGPGGNYGTTVCKPFDPWETDRSWEAGYLAGAFDGEGWVDTNGAHHFRMGFAQRENEMRETVVRCLKELHVDFREYLHTSGFTDKPIKNIMVANQREVARLLGMVRPQRLLANMRPEGLGAVQGSHVRLVRKEFVGEREVVALQTDCRTYLAEGLASHNCVVPVGYSREGVVAVTWGSTVTITWEWWHTYVVQTYTVVPPAFAEKGGDGRGFDLAQINGYLAAA